MEHSAVGESSSEQQIRESTDYTCIVRKNWSPSHSGTRSYGRQAGRQAGRRAGRQAGRRAGRQAGRQAGH